MCRPSVTGVALAWLDFVCRFVSRSAAEHLARPDLLAGVQIQRVHAPGVMRQVLHRRDIAVQAGAERRVLGTCRGDGNHAIAPDDGAGGGQPRNGQSSSGCCARSRRPSRSPRLVHRRCHPHWRLGTPAKDVPRRGARKVGWWRTQGVRRAPKAVSPREWPRPRSRRQTPHARSGAGRSRARSSIARQCRRGPRR